MKRIAVLTILFSLLWLGAISFAVTVAAVFDAFTHKCACACQEKEPTDFWECRRAVIEEDMHCAHNADLCDRLLQSNLDLCEAHFGDNDTS